ncbi:hypothetical protein, partial [Streptomyces sp. NPDC052036]|uniref:hypothetical protein n=1 Tax=Streptomyces sp. NPDC052036 TaxID=3155171 RepID=UPI0034389B93
MSDSHGSVQFNPDDVYTLGHAVITFGDQLDEQLAATDGAQFDLLNGSWMGDASMAMTFAWEDQDKGTDAGVEAEIIQVVEQLWDLGEAINYYAMLRTEQEKTLAKELLAGSADPGVREFVIFSAEVGGRLALLLTWAFRLF